MGPGKNASPQQCWEMWDRPWIQQTSSYSLEMHWQEVEGEDHLGALQLFPKGLGRQNKSSQKWTQSSLLSSLVPTTTHSLNAADPNSALSPHTE